MFHQINFPRSVKYGNNFRGTDGCQFQVTPLVRHTHGESFHSGDCICLFQNLRNEDSGFRQFWRKMLPDLHIPAQRPFHQQCAVNRLLFANVCSRVCLFLFLRTFLKCWLLWLIQFIKTQKNWERFCIPIPKNHFKWKDQWMTQL